MDFGKRLRELRTEKNLTQEQLAKQINLSKANVSKYEANSVEPNLDTLALISNLFDVSVNYLLGLPEKERQKSNFQKLDKHEKLLIEKYRSMSPQGQEYILQTINMAAETYKKGNSITDHKDIG